MDKREIERMLGAVLGGRARSQRRTTRSIGYGTSRGASSILGTVLSVGAKALVDYMTRSSESSPGPQRPPQGARPVPGPARSVPQTGHSPWTQAEAPVPSAPAGSSDSSESMLLLRVAIAAAKADGVLDATERAHVTTQLDAAGLGENERDFVLNELQNPISIDEIGRAVRDPMLAAQVYAAAFATIGVAEAMERDWLNRLAARLRLEAPAVAAIEARLAPSGSGNA